MYNKNDYYDISKKQPNYYNVNNVYYSFSINCYRNIFKDMS